MGLVLIQHDLVRFELSTTFYSFINVVNLTIYSQVPSWMGKKVIIDGTPSYDSRYDS